MSDKPLRWLHGEVKSPPFSKAARAEAGDLLRALQRGVKLPMPLSRPMPAIGPRCHELRVHDEAHNWRIIYRIDADRILIATVFAKTTQATPKPIIKVCQKRLQEYEAQKREDV